MSPFGRFVEPQFLVTLCTVSLSGERKLSKFFIENLLEVFGRTVLRCCSQRRFTRPFRLRMLVRVQRKTNWLIWDPLGFQRQLMVHRRALVSLFCGYCFGFCSLEHAPAVSVFVAFLIHRIRRQLVTVIKLLLCFYLSTFCRIVELSLFSLTCNFSLFESGLIN